MAIAADSTRVRTPYYACALGRRVISDGHRWLLPDKECVEDVSVYLESPDIEAEHDDSDWDAAIRELMADPRSAAAHIPATGADTPAGVSAPLGPLPGKKLKQFGDVHTFPRSTA